MFIEIMVFQMHEKDIEIPEKVEIDIQGMRITVKGPQGEINREFRMPGISIEKKDNRIYITSISSKRRYRAMVGTVHAHISNMIKGVTNKFTGSLKIVQTHFPLTARVKGNLFTIENFFGEKNPRKIEIPPDVKIEVKGDTITVTGIDKEVVGQTMANLERLTYWNNGRDKRVFQDGIYIVEKPR